MYYFEDFTPGLRLTTHSHTLTEAEIIDFATHYDPQTFHTDPVLAANSVFGGHAASGWHTASASMRLVVDTFAHRVAGGLVGMQIDGLRWPRPTRPNDQLTVTLEVLSTRRSTSQPGFGVVHWSWETHNQHNDTLLTLKNAIWVPARDLPPAA